MDYKVNNKFDFDTPVERHGTDSVKWDEWPNKEVLPLWVADMDFRTAPAIIDALEKRVAHGVFGYTHPGTDYFAAIDKWFTRRHNWSIPRENILYTTGVVPATSAVIKGLTNPGDGVVILTPVYTCFFSSIRNNGCEIVESPLRLVEGRYIIDFENLEEKLSRDTTKILLLCNPHNPGGRVWSEEELKHIDALCAMHNVIVLSDEIHCEIVMPGNKYTPFANVATRPYVSMISPSKAFNTAGLHIANIVSPSAEIRARIDRAININETCDVGPFGVVGLIAAYRDGETWLEAMINYVYENYLFLKNELSDVSAIEVLSMEGTYLAWIDVHDVGIKVAEMTDRLRREAKIWFHPGTAYGEDGEGFIRINLATSRSVLAEALHRFKNWLRNNS